MGRTDVNKAKAMKTVLIVSDNAQINTLLNETLHDDGHRVISFTEGATPAAGGPGKSSPDSP
jgi:DNA-binding NtrC family response regulator